MRRVAITFILSATLLLVIAGGQGVSYIMMHRECLGNLKRAADANSVQLAQQELDTALAYMDKHQLNDGYTSVIYTTPDEDIGFWYQNITACKQDLDSLPQDASQLERSNVLMKLRETLLDHGGQRGDTLTYPDGIAWHPYNTELAIANVVCMLLLCGTGFMLAEDSAIGKALRDTFRIATE